MRTNITSASWLINNKNVLYPSLELTHPDLYSTSKLTINELDAPKTSIYSTVATELKSMAQAEHEKELNFLEHVFGIRLKYDFDNPNFEAELVQTLNELLQFKAVFNRHRARLLAGETNITISAFYGSYLNQALNEHMDEFVGILKSNLNNFAALKQASVDYIKNVVHPRAIELMFSAKALNGDKRTKKFLKDNGMTEDDLGAYTEVLTAMKRLKSVSTVFSKQLINLYGLDQLGQTIAENIMNREKGQHYKTNVRNSVSVVAKTNFQKGGSVMEYIMQLMANLKFDGHTNFEGGMNTGGTSGGGGAGLTDDVILSLGIPIKFLENKLSVEGQATSRKRNVDIMEGLSKFLDKIDDDVSLVHINAKNYGLNEDFIKRKGFQAAENMSLDTFSYIVAEMGKGSTNLIGAICNTIPGAIGENYKGTLETVVAADIAYLLFDDAANIGMKAELIPGARANSIHLLYLSGFYYPLSVFLNNLAQAFTQGANILQQATATIKTPAGLKYAEKEAETISKHGIGVTWDKSEWDTQRTEALTQIRISMHFMSSFEATIKKALTTKI